MKTPDPSAPRDLSDVLVTLQRTPRALDVLLRGLPGPVARRPYAPRAFSAYNVLGHLIVGERDDWIPRLRIIMEHGESRPFDPFDHRATIEPSSGRSLDELLDEFAELRAGNLEELEGACLTQEQLEQVGIHPSLGRVSARQLLWTWAAHDLHHTAQACKALVGRFEEGVGPWRPCMGIFAMLKSPP